MRLVFDADFELEVFRVKGREGFAELIEFLRGAMEFKAAEIGELEETLEDGADVCGVRESAGGTHVGLPAIEDAVTNREVVVEALVFRGGLGDEFTQDGPDLVEFAGVNPEVGVNAEDVCGLGHGVDGMAVSGGVTSLPCPTFALRVAAGKHRVG